MGDQSKIEWTRGDDGTPGATWNPVVGCTAVSSGCDFCYAARDASGRLAHTPAYAGLARDGRFTGEVRLLPDRLDKPRHWRKPRRIFVNSMGDLFHEGVSDEYIARVWQVMASCPQHQFIVLTKRHARMRAWVNRCKESPGGWITHDGTDPAGAYDGTGIIVGYPPPTWERRTRGPRGGKLRYPPQPMAWGWPLPNVVLGVSAEDQHWAQIRVHALLDTPAAERAVSAEPLLGPIDLRNLQMPGGPVLDALCGDVKSRKGEIYAACPGSVTWVITGGESGPQARPVHPEWVRSLRDQCEATRTPFFFKQFGEYLPVPVVDAPGFSGGRAITLPSGGQIAATIHERSAKAFQPGDTRPMQPGDTNGHGVMLDADTFAVRVGKKAAGNTLDGRVWEQYPQVRVS